ncbi:MAG: hypothetical protein ABI806_12460 [Candidatus Solibacter sp.]
MKSSAVSSALLILLPWSALAADDMGGAIRELARKTIAFAGRGEPVTVSWRNVSTMSPGDSGQVQAAFEGALREAGTRVSEIAPILEARITLSANTTQFLLVEEARKGEDRQVWIASWKRTAAPGATISLEKKLLLEQEEQILDVAVAGQGSAGEGLLVLTPSRIAWRAGSGEQSVSLVSSRPWPRDLRGHLRVNGGGFKAYLPGVLCAGALEPMLSMECRPSDEPWTLDMGTRGVLLANFAAGRNHFDGRVAPASGVRKTLAPFYSVGAAEEGGRTYFLVAMVDGRTQILDVGLTPSGSIAGWGSDLAGTEARCGGGSQILATKAGDAGEPDAVRAYGIVNRTAAPLSPAMELPGPVTALWSSGSNWAVAVVRDAAAGKYQAYAITVNCHE